MYLILVRVADLETSKIRWIRFRYSETDFGETWASDRAGFSAEAGADNPILPEARQRTAQEYSAFRRSAYRQALQV
jgi:hypothetical protein